MPHDEFGVRCGQPPHHIEVVLMPVRVLHRHRRLAHPTRALHRTHRGRAPCGQLLGHSRQQHVPADEPRQPRRHIPHRRQIRREHRSHPHRGHTISRPANRPNAREPRLHRRFTACGPRGPHHPIRRDTPIHPEHIHRHDLTEQPRPRTLLHPEHQQRPRPPKRISLPGRLPLRRREHRFQVGRRQHRHRPRRGPRSLVHRLHEARPGAEIPGLDQHPVAGSLQRPGDPLRPRLIFPGVGHEEIRAGNLAAPHGHPSSMPLSSTMAETGRSIAVLPDRPRRQPI